VRRALGGNDAVLGEVTAHGVDDLCALAHVQIPRAEDQGARLSRLGLHRNKAHRRPLRGFANGLHVSHVVLLALDERLHVFRRDQPDLMPELSDLPSPVMRAPAGLESHHARLQGCEERQHLGSRRLLAEDDLSRRVGPVSLKGMLRDVQPNHSNPTDALLRVLFSDFTLAHLMPSGSVHPITTVPLTDLPVLVRHRPARYYASGMLRSRPSWRERLAAFVTART
jgi:hypothetical protein